jgi:hypothetical protein
MLKERINTPWRLRRTKEGVQRHMCAIVHFWSCLLLDTLMNFPIGKFALFFAPKHWKRPRSVGSRIPAQWIFMQEILQQNSDSPSHIFVKQMKCMRNIWSIHTREEMYCNKRIHLQSLNCTSNLPKPCWICLSRCQGLGMLMLRLEETTVAIGHVLEVGMVWLHAAWLRLWPMA